MEQLNIFGSNATNTNWQIAGVAQGIDDLYVQCNMDVVERILGRPDPLHAVPGHRSEVPIPEAKWCVRENCILLQWDLPAGAKDTNISYFDVFALIRRNGNEQTCPDTLMKVISVERMPLPMACIIESFTLDVQYDYFVRAVFRGGTLGYFSDPATIMFSQGTNMQF